MMRIIALSSDCIDQVNPIAAFLDCMQTFEVHSVLKYNYCTKVSTNKGVSDNSVPSRVFKNFKDFKEAFQRSRMKVYGS